jgi:integrase
MPRVESRTTKHGTRYFVRFRLNRIQTSLTFGSRHEALAFARDIENRGAEWAWENHQREADVADEMTLSEWAERHFASITHVTEDTLTNYRRDWRRRWEPHLGHMKLSRITREDIAAALAKQTGADKTIANAWGTLATMLKVAVEDGHLARSPAKGIKLPKRTDHERAEHRYMTGDELRRVIADTPERYRPLMWTLVGTGMRWSEATALTVADVNLAARTVRVTKAFKRDQAKGVWYVGPTKTRKSRRTITLPNETVTALEPLVDGRPRGAFLFTNRRDEPIRHQTFYREHWLKKCIANIDDPKPRIHDIRHSHVALLIAAGTSLPVIQARLGHEKVTTTIDTYGHLLPDLQVAAARAADAVLARPPTPPELEN